MNSRQALSSCYLSAMVPLLLTVDDVACELSVSARTVKRLISAKSIPTVRIGASVRVPSDLLKDWVE